MNEQELRESIAKEIEAAGVKLSEDAKYLGPDAYLVATSMTMGFAALVRNPK